MWILKYWIIYKGSLILGSSVHDLEVAMKSTKIDKNLVFFPNFTHYFSGFGDNTSNKNKNWYDQATSMMQGEQMHIPTLEHFGDSYIIIILHKPM